MIFGIEPLYQRIADSIQNAIDEEWSTAKMEAIFFSDSITYLGEYRSSASGRLKGFITNGEGEAAFREIRDRFRKAGKKPFGCAAFELFADGRFDMKFGYENCDQNGDTVFLADEYARQHEERRKRFGAD